MFTIIGPLLITGLVRGDDADGFGDGCSAVVGWVFGVLCVDGVVLGVWVVFGFVGEFFDVCTLCVLVFWVSKLVLGYFVPVFVDDGDK
jgi:hypothetical protein